MTIDREQAHRRQVYGPQPPVLWRVRNASGQDQAVDVVLDGNQVRLTDGTSLGVSMAGIDLAPTFRRLAQLSDFQLGLAYTVGILPSVFLDDRPEDTDVFLVLSRKPQVPEYVVSQSFYFRIEVDGEIIAYDRETEGR
jgi:hypothetical protein